MQFPKGKDPNLYSRLFMAGSLTGVVLAGLGYVGVDIWLASTQWLLVAAILALFGIYMRLD
jgi:hypothetical protein